MRKTHRVATLASRSGTGKVLYPRAAWYTKPMPTAQDRLERTLTWFLIDLILVAIGLSALIVVAA